MAVTAYNVTQRTQGIGIPALALGKAQMTDVVEVILEKNGDWR